MASALNRLLRFLKGRADETRFGQSKRNPKRMLGAFLRDETGSYIIIMALFLPVVIGTAALAVDGGYWAYNHLTLQSAADSAAASVAKVYTDNKSANLTTEAEAIAVTYGITSCNGCVVVHNPPQSGSGTCDLASSDTYIGNDEAFEVIVTGKGISALLSSLTTVSICARAVAALTGGDCMLALDPTAAGAVAASGGASLTFSGCGIFSNSDASSASGKKSCGESICLSGSATITAPKPGKVGTVGGVSVLGGASIPDGYTTGDTAELSPYAGVVLPSSSSASYTSPPLTCGTSTASPYSGTPKGTNITLTSASVVNPGVYCGKVTVNATPKTINAGTYTFEDLFTVSGGSPTLPSGTYTFGAGIAVSAGTLTTNSGTYTIYGAGAVPGIAVSGGQLIMSSGSSIYTIYSGTTTAGAIAVSGTGNVTLDAGTYILNSQSANANAITLTVGNSGELTGTGATLVFTSSSDEYPATMMQFSGAAVVNLTAPTTGATAGLVILGDNTMPVGTQFLVSNGATLNFTGAIDVPRALFTFSGGTSTKSPCSQFIADTFNLTGSGSFANNCSGTGTSPIGANAVLVE